MKVTLNHLGCVSMGKFYAVRIGRETGVFNNWKDCELQVKGYPGAQYKSFLNIIEAEMYLEDSKITSTELSEDTLRIYVDGSYSKSQKRAGFGCVFVKNEAILKEVSKETTISSNDNLWNVSAEIAGVLYAVEWCIKKKISSIDIYYDYEGLRSWYHGSWKTNKETTINYVKKMNDFKKYININFIKVKAHSGNYFNEKADILAKKAISNIEKKIDNSIKDNTIDIYINLDQFNEIIGDINKEKTIIVCEGFCLNDRIIDKLAKFFWKKDKNKINDLENIKSTFDVESMLLNIKYDQKNTDSQITKILKLEGK